MPRQASAAAEFGTTTRPLIQPPGDLNDLERAEFVNLVVGAPANHFLPSDLPLLAAYSKSIVEERVAAGELSANPVVDGKPSPWLPIWQAKIRACTTLARMLALSPGGRVPSKSSEAQEPVSYYEKMRLLESRNDEPNN